MTSIRESDPLVTPTSVGRAQPGFVPNTDLVSSALAALHAAGEALRTSGYDVFVNALRAAEYHDGAAWLDKALPQELRKTQLGFLFSLLHQGRACTAKSLPPRQARALVDAGLADEAAGVLVPSSWFVSAYRDLIAVRDRRGDGSLDSSNVYLGEDSLRFVDWITTHESVDTALDIGSGSGISSAALARKSRRTLAVDIDQSCCIATRVTAALNGLAHKVEAIDTDILSRCDFARRRRFDLIVANPPDVPVPRGLSYSHAGHGGEDGLRLIRRILEAAPGWLSSRGSIRMHFHAVGTDTSPAVAQLIERLADQHGWNVILVCHSRVPMLVRSAITTRWAGFHNPSLNPAELLDRCDTHAANLGATHFYGCTLVIRAGGNAQLTMLPSHRDRHLDGVRFHLRTHELTPATTVTAIAAYMRNLRLLPDGIHELPVHAYMTAPALRAAELLALLAQGATIREATDKAFAEELSADPVNARVLYVLVMKLFDAFCDIGLAERSQ
jgi:ribosomal protein L11 methylase PrmA